MKRVVLVVSRDTQYLYMLILFGYSCHTHSLSTAFYSHVAEVKYSDCVYTQHS